MMYRTWTEGIILLQFRKREETIAGIQGVEIQQWKKKGGVSWFCLFLSHVLHRNIMSRYVN